MGSEQKSIDFDYSIDAYQYDLPPERIAQQPAENRDGSRLLVLNRRQHTLEDLLFPDIIHYLQPRDLLVVNDTRVFPARIMGRKESGGRVELFLLEYPPGPGNSGPMTTQDLRNITASPLTVTALIKSSKRPRPGTRLLFGSDLEGRVEELLPDGKALVSLFFRGNVDDILATCGQVPLPPYIRRPDTGYPSDQLRYQTLYANRTGAVAAPTAGLHFSESLLATIKARGIKIAAVTLHVGYGTFAPVRVTDIRHHTLHEEYVIIPRETARLANETKKKGGRIWAVGTTTVRTLEIGADANGWLQEKEGWCNLYIYPGYQFRLTDNMITNFHLPGSSLLFLVAALAGREFIMASYQQAIDLNYRFYSYGDAMAIIT
jgi:S-adenosylmethionine:tRNA ribosyltransferase-isomerase